MPKIIVALVGVTALLSSPVSSALAEETPSNKTCTVDTAKDSSTGEERSGVRVCDGEVGVSFTNKEVKHFLKYPIGQSDASVAKHVGNAVHKFFKRL